MPRYNPATIEAKWQATWDEQKTFATDPLPKGGKLYVLDMFPYPSGDGLHVGHPEGYTATDIVCRTARMQGKSVVHPIGFDSFGLPAEEHAIKTGEHPRFQTERNIDNFRRQLKMLGFSYDWDRELATTDVGYVRWTQWIFLVLYDTWFDPEVQRGRPIDELPIPSQVARLGEDAVRQYQDEHRLAYQSEAPVNWCPALGTVLANEEVVDGKSEVGGHPVVRKPLRQWMLRITAYADRLEQDLEDLDWPESVKRLQRNWIGRSMGAEVDFVFTGRDQGADAGDDVPDVPSLPQDGCSDDRIRVYTTRPDTLFGATYMVLAPEHPLVPRITTAEQADAVAAYREQAATKSDLDRTDLAKEKTGVFTGAHAINPVNGEHVPIWIADYVLISYGTGAIMAVPAHDHRDFEFAQQFGIPIRAVVDPGPPDGPNGVKSSAAQPLPVATSVTMREATRDGPLPAGRTRSDGVGADGMGAIERNEILAGQRVFTGTGTAIHSGSFDGLPTAQFQREITAWLNDQGVGRPAVNYKLRDWLFSRQRFWGEPFPILHRLDAEGHPTGEVRAVAPEELPVDLPHLEDFKPHGRKEPPLDQAPDDWLYPVIAGVQYKRETNTMPQWAGSCWYYLRFLDPNNDRALVDPEIEKAWMPVDLYVGGTEHAVLHLLYARFWHKVLFDRGIVSTHEPFRKLVNQGMILGEDGSKMSKSRGNVINPDTVVAEYGADSLRLYEMFMGPLEATKPWNMDGVSGVHGFLNRVWRMIVDERSDTMQLSTSIRDMQPTEEQNRVLHKTIQAVTEDIRNLEFNTPIARMMECTNFFTKQAERPKEAMEKLVLLLSPFAPHIAEELWQILGQPETLAYESWPTFDESLLVEAEIEIPVQINGKLRAKIRVPADATQDAIRVAAREHPRIAKLIEGKRIIKNFVVPGRMVNFVVG